LSVRRCGKCGKGENGERREKNPWANCAGYDNYALEDVGELRQMTLTIPKKGDE
jgi:hypothetical protein